MPKKFADGWNGLAVMANVAQIVGLRAFVRYWQQTSKARDKHDLVWSRV